MFITQAVGYITVLPSLLRVRRVAPRCTGDERIRGIATVIGGATQRDIREVIRQFVVVLVGCLRVPALTMPAGDCPTDRACVVTALFAHLAPSCINHNFIII